MATKALGKFGRYALLFSPVVIVVGGFLAAIPWLKDQSDTLVLALTAAAAIFVMGYAHYIENRLERHLDEVQIASQRFATSRGWAWGGMPTVLLLLLPPVSNGLIDLANRMSTGSPDLSDRGAVHVALFFGFCLVVVMQAISVLVASMIWWRRMEHS